MTDSLERGVSIALGDATDDYDIEGIAAALRDQGAQTVNDLSAEDFWALVSEHEVRDEIEAVAPLDRFRAEVEAVLKTPVEAPAVWQRGGVTLEITGHSRAGGMTLPPQPLAAFRLTVLGSEPVEWGPWSAEVFSWPRLWEEVEKRISAWTAEAEERREAYRRDLHEADAASLRARRAASAAEAAHRALAAITPADETTGEDAQHMADRPTVSADDVAEYLGIDPASVRKQMSRWEIDGVVAYESGGQPRTRYPRAEVQAKAARRPGRGARTDLR
ncbi:hypothetical protein ABZ682_19140 [Streptomyces griseoviridis]|uniref:hypothetical protein n=1 Tax=Streptomyces griseoviridis TaxID=45398 RepID=UPI0033DA7DA7